MNALEALKRYGQHDVFCKSQECVTRETIHVSRETFRLNALALTKRADEGVCVIVSDAPDLRGLGHLIIPSHMRGECSCGLDRIIKELEDG